MGLFNFLNKSLNVINNGYEDVDDIKNIQDEEDINKDKTFGMSDEEKKEMKQNNYQAEDFDEESDGNVDDYYKEDGNK